MASLCTQLGVTSAEAVRRLWTQAGQTTAAERLTWSLGAHAAGACMEAASGTLVVNMLDAATAGQVHAVGATPQLVGDGPGVQAGRQDVGCGWASACRVRKG